MAEDSDEETNDEVMLPNFLRPVHLLVSDTDRTDVRRA